MMCTTGLHGGVCHRTSTPHKSGIKMKKKKKFIIALSTSCNNRSVGKFLSLSVCFIELS